MRGVNKVILIGSLGDEPIMKTTNGGKNVAQLSVATNEQHKDQNGQYAEVAEWHRVVLWDKLADIAKQYLHKGTQVYLEGRLRTRKYTDKNGVDRYITEVVANSLIMLGGKKDGNSAAPSYPYGQNNSGGIKPMYDEFGRPLSNNNNNNGYGQAPAQGYTAPPPVQNTQAANQEFQNDIPF